MRPRIIIPLICVLALPGYSTYVNSAEAGGMHAAERFSSTVETQLGELNGILSGSILAYKRSTQADAALTMAETLFAWGPFSEVLRERRTNCNWIRSPFFNWCPRKKQDTEQGTHEL